MLNFTVDIRNVLKTLSIFIVLNVFWTICCVLSNEFTGIDKGLITGLGFLTFFGLSFYISQNKRKTSILFFLIAAFSLTFLISSFLISFISFKLSTSLVLYSILSSIFTSTVLTLVLHRIYGIQFIIATIVVTMLLAILAHYFILQFNNSPFFIGYYYLSPRIFMFLVYQGLVSIGLTLGLNLKKSKELPDFNPVKKTISI